MRRAFGLVVLAALVVSFTTGAVRILGSGAPVRVSAQGADAIDPSGQDPNTVTVTLADGDGDGPLPPSVEERSNALSVLDASRSSITALGERHEVVLVRAVGPAFAGESIDLSDPCSARRCIDVTVYLYPSDRVLDVFVAQGRVVRTTFSRGQPPLDESERARAHMFADADADVVDHLAGERHTHLVLAYPMWRDTSPCDEHRCASVVYPLDSLATTGIGREATIVVDLSAMRIVERLYLRCAPECVPGWSR